MNLYTIAGYELNNRLIVISINTIKADSEYRPVVSHDGKLRGHRSANYRNIHVGGTNKCTFICKQFKPSIYAYVRDDAVTSARGVS